MGYIVKHRPTAHWPSLFDDFFTRDSFDHRTKQRTSVPAVNIMETEQQYALELVAPGWDKENFHVSLEEDTLTISGSLSEDSTEDLKDTEYKRKEFTRVAFTRSFRLPEGSINEENITAEYRNGILYVGLPKKEEEPVKETKRLIEIS